MVKSPCRLSLFVVGVIFTLGCIVAAAIAYPHVGSISLRALVGLPFGCALMAIGMRHTPSKNPIKEIPSSSAVVDPSNSAPNMDDAHIYPNNLKNWNFDCAKTPGLIDRNRPHISNIGSVTIDQSREFSRQPKSNSSGCLGIPTVSDLTFTTKEYPGCAIDNQTDYELEICDIAGQGNSIEQGFRWEGERSGIVLKKGDELHILYFFLEGKTATSLSEVESSPLYEIIFIKDGGYKVTLRFQDTEKSYRVLKIPKDQLFVRLNRVMLRLE